MIARFKALILAVAFVFVANTAFGEQASVSRSKIEVGTVVTSYIDTSSGKIYLPIGRWKIIKFFEDSDKVTREGGNSFGRAKYNLTLDNTSLGSLISTMTLSWTEGANVDWQGQPCNNEWMKNWVYKNSFETRENSTVIKCVGVTTFKGNFQSTISNASAATGEFFRNFYGGAPIVRGDHPVRPLVGYIYATRYQGNKLTVNIFFNPEIVGLTSADDFVEGSPTNSRQRLGKEFIQSAGLWASNYLNLIQGSYFESKTADSSPDRKFAFDKRIEPPAASFNVAVTPPVNPAQPMPLQAIPQVAKNEELDRLRAEAEAAKQREAEARQRQEVEALAAAQRQRELEEKLKLAQQQAAPQAPAAPAVNAHALIIGNAAYAGTGRLDNPVNDARAMSAKLRALGFTVTEVADANRSRLVSSLAQFSRSAANADLTLLFYSGHGVQVFGTNYVLPIDVDQTDLAQATLQGVSLNAVIEQFMPGKTKLVFLDACRTNPLARTASKGFTKGLAPISVSEGTLISYAAKDGQEALDGAGQRNSPFTAALLEHINDPDDIAVVLRKVREKVMKATGGKQQPWEYGSLTGGALVLSAMKRAR